MIFTEISNVNDAIYIHLDKDAHSSKSQAEASSKVMIDICYIHDFFTYMFIKFILIGVIHKLREQDFGCFWPLPSPWLFTFTTECEHFFEIFDPYPSFGCSRNL